MRWTHRHTRDFVIHVGQFAEGESHFEIVPRLLPHEDRPPRGAIVAPRDINFVTQGEFHVRMPKSGTLRMVEGAGAYPASQAGRMRITCVTATGEWLCLIPRQLDQFWGRDVIMLQPGESFALKRSRRLRSVCVATGRASVRDQPYDPHTVIRVEPGRTGVITAVSETRLLLMTAKGPASLKPMAHPDPSDWPVIEETPA